MKNRFRRMTRISVLLMFGAMFFAYVLPTNVLTLSSTILGISSWNGGSFMTSMTGNETSGGTLTGEGTESSPYLITSAADWDLLSNHINNGGTDYNGKYFKLTNDISVTTMLGYRNASNVDIPFVGTFDGDGHTLTVAIKYNGSMAAPFGAVCNTVIKNLNVKGTVNGGIHSSGLVGAGNRGAIVGSTLEIYNVTTSVTVTGYNGGAVSHLGGIVGHTLSARITMDNVVFSGSLNGSTAQGGFIGWGGGAGEKLSVCTFRNCLFAGSVRSGNTFHPVGFAYNNYGQATLTNFYTTIDKNNNSNAFDYQGTNYVLLGGLTARVKDGGAIRYYDNFASAISSTNWTAGSTLTLLTNITTSSTITIPSGEHTLDLNGHGINRTGATGNDNSGLVITMGGGVNLTVTGPGKITGGSGFHGGGIHVEGNSSLVLDNCEISSNTGHYGGGLYLKNGIITLKNGTVVKNNSATEGFGGSGIYAEGSGTLVLEGGTFTNNEIRNNNQYAVFLAGNANVQVSGAPVIYDNKYGSAQKNLYMYQAGDQHSIVRIAGALTDGTKIGAGQTTGAGEITSGWKDRMGDADPSEYFTSDNEAYDVFLNKNGEAEIGVPPVAILTVGETETKYTSFSDAVTAWTNASFGAVLTLQRDVTTTAAINFKGTKTLDLNGYGIRYAGSGRASVLIASTWHSNSAAAVLTVNDSNPRRLHKITLSGYRGTAAETVATMGNTAVDANGNGTVYVSGGYITGGTGTLLSGSVYIGGALYIRGDTKLVTINGGTFVGNACDFGGMMHSSHGAISLNGGSICYNKGNGAAFNLDGLSRLYLSGGEISYNTSGIRFATDNGDTVLSLGGSNGSTAFADNGEYDITLSSGKVINIAGALTNTTPIVVKMSTVGKFTYRWTTRMGETDPAQYFASGNSGYSVFLNENGEAEIGVPPAACVISGETKTNYNSFPDAVSSTNWTAGSTLKLMSDVTTSSTITVSSGEHTLDLNGHGIKKTGTGCVIKVNEQSTLNLKDSNTSTEHKYKIANPAGNGAGVATVDDTLTSGYQTFTGGYITGGYITGGYNYGAGINVEGNGAALNMYGGTIIGNRLTAGSTGGGGVCLQDWDKSGGFNMYGGLIIGNTANYGGGVYVRCGTMVMHDGEIRNNVANNNIGGALLAFGSSSTFIMEDGAINGNYAQHGGAIEASGGSTVSIFGGTITNNTATGKGGALTNQRSDGDSSPAVFNISGAPVFSGNTAGGKSSDVYLCNTAVLNLTEALTNTTPFGVSRSSATGAFTSGWKDKMGDADPAQYFTSDNSQYIIRVLDGEAHVTPPHIHNWNYTADGAVITATCGGDTPCFLEAQTLTVAAAGKVYDGTAVTATVTKSAAWSTGNGLTEPGAVTYSGNTDAGDYTATLTVGGASAVAAFTISPKSMASEVSVSAQNKPYDGNAYGISVVGPEGATVKFGTAADSCTLDASPTFTNAGTHTVYYEVTRKNYITVSGSAPVVITPISAVVTVVGSNSTLDYDGGEHTVTGYTATCGQPLYDVTKDVSFTGTATASRTNAGTTAMGLTSSQFANTNPNFCDVTFLVTDGYQKIEPICASVTVVGTASTLDYDGTAHTVTGYVASADTPLYDVASAFTFSGNATATRTDAGTAKMGLAPSQFTNTDANFKSVTFAVIDGFQKIEPIGASVAVTGNVSTLDYDGKAHTVTGYTAVADTPLYDVSANIAFSGIASATQTNAGTAAMGLTADQFANTSSNFKTVTFTVTDGWQKIEPIDATVTITGNVSNVKYDGKEHTVIGCKAVADTGLYSVLKDFTFSGSATVSATDAGTVKMGLAADQFANINPNFRTVTFNVTDGYIEIAPIDVTVTVTGNTATANYDGKAHTVTGYTAACDITLYDVAKAVSFSGSATASRIDAGKTEMGLAPSQFTNTDPNFGTVTFEITDGYQTVLTVDAAVKTVPASAKPAYNGSYRSLVAPGVAEGGTVLYALGKDMDNAPEDGYAANVPVAKEVGHYYVWYKVKADQNHNDLDAECVKVTLGEEDWITLTGTLYESDGKTPLAGADVSLTKGSVKIDAVVTGADGKYSFTVPAGIYNLVADHGDVTETMMVKALEDVKQDIVSAGGRTESVLKVSGESGSGFGVAVDGLDKEAKAIRADEKISAERDVTVQMTVKPETEKTSAKAQAIASAAVNKSLVYFDVKVEKTVDSETGAISETSNVLEIAVPFSKASRRGLMVYYTDGSTVSTLRESDSREEGTFFIDKENGFVYIYSNRFSTFAIGYTPYFRVNSTVSLGSFDGAATVTVAGQDNEEVFKLENVSLDQIRFPDIPKGKYTMTVSWRDGTTNTLTIPLTVS